MSQKVILFFIAGMVPTEAERAAAGKLGTSRFRNAQLAVNDSIEKCDAVAGLVPEAYRGTKGIKVLEAPEPATSSPPTPRAPDAPKPKAPTSAPATEV